MVRLGNTVVAFAMMASLPAFAQDAPLPEQGGAPQLETEIALLDDERFGGLRRPSPDVPPPADEVFTIEGTVGVVSDFKRAGLSYTNGKPAVQGELAVEHRSGLFGSIFVSTLAPNGGANFEVDVSLGYAFPIGKFEGLIGVIDYITPGVAGSNYYELQAGLSRQIGESEFGISAAYSPSQKNIGGEDSLYLGASAEVPIAATPLTISAAAGVEDGAFGDYKLDWSLGGTYTIAEKFDLGLTYFDAARTFGEPHTNAKLVFSLSTTF
jgi:uncharacterized protein (TIGR02001 family)